MNLRQAVVFAILMENGIGIMGKSPDYVMEKLEGCEELCVPEGIGLDAENMEKFKAYHERWDRLFALDWDSQKDYNTPIPVMQKRDWRG